MGHSEGTDSIHDADHLIFLYSFSPTSPLYLSSYIPLYILIPLTRFPIPNQIRNSLPFPNVQLLCCTQFETDQEVVSFLFFFFLHGKLFYTETVAGSRIEVQGV